MAVQLDRTDRDAREPDGQPASLAGAWCLITAEAVEELSLWIEQAVLGGAGRPQLTADEEAGLAEVDAHAEELVLDLRDKKDELAGDAQKIFSLLGDIPTIVGWDRGLEDCMHSIVRLAVRETERFGSGLGELKRRFATSLVIRILERYNIGGLPFLPMIEKSVIAPLVGILIDWSVETFDIHYGKVWPTTKKVTFPRLFRGGYGWLIKIALWCAGAILWLKKYILFPSKYEYELRDAMRTLEPDVRRLLLVLPPDHLHTVLEELTNTLLELGKKTLPYVHLVNDAIRISSEIASLSTDARNEAIFLMLRRLAREAFKGDTLALIFIDSPVGAMVLRTLVRHTSHIVHTMPENAARRAAVT